MLRKVLKEKCRKEVKKMIHTGEIHQYYASPEETVRAVAARMKYPKFIARKIICKADERRANSFARSLKQFDLPATVARWCA